MSFDRRELSWAIPASVLDMPTGGEARVSARLTVLGVAPDAATFQTRFVVGGHGDSPDGAYLEWPTLAGENPVATMVRPYAPSITDAQASNILFTVGSEDYFYSTQYELKVNGNSVVSASGWAAFESSPIVSVVSLGQNAAVVRADLAGLLTPNATNSIELVVTNPNGTFSDDGSVWLSEFGAEWLFPSKIDSFAGADVSVTTIRVFGQAQQAITLTDVSSTLTFEEAQQPFASQVTVVMDSAGDGVVTMADHYTGESVATFAPIVITAAGLPRIQLQIGQDVLSGDSLTGEEFDAGTKLGLGGPARKGGMPQPPPPNPGPHPNQATLDKFIAIWSSYTVYACFEGEEDGSTVGTSGDIDVTDCVNVEWIAQVQNGQAGGHYSTNVNTACLAAKIAALDPPLSDVDHIHFRAVKKPGAPSEYPSEVDCGSFHVTT